MRGLVGPTNSRLRRLVLGHPSLHTESDTFSGAEGVTDSTKTCQNARKHCDAQATPQQLFGPPKRFRASHTCCMFARIASVAGMKQNESSSARNTSSSLRQNLGESYHLAKSFNASSGNVALGPAPPKTQHQTSCFCGQKLVIKL